MTGVITTIPKHKRIKLHGQAVKELNDRIHERDGHCCVLCHKPVDDDEKWHHERSGIKNDVEEEGVTLCYKCHYERHFGEKSDKIRERCRSYLIMLYGKDLWHAEG